MSSKQLEMQVWSSWARTGLETKVLNHQCKEVMGLNEIIQGMNGDKDRAQGLSPSAHPCSAEKKPAMERKKEQ